MAELEDCTAYEIASIDGVGSCSEDADCTSGYCELSVGACQVATANTCSDDMECASNAACTAGQCTFSSQPVSISRALLGTDGSATDNLKPFLRLYVELSVDDPLDPPPILYEWSLTYLCTTTE